MRRLLTAMGGVLTLSIVLPAAAFAESGEPVAESMTAQPADAATFGGTVDAIDYADGRFFVGGDYEVSNYDGKRHDRTSLAVVNPDGSLGKFAPELDGPVSALTHDSEYLYVTGRFTEADGHGVQHVARFDLETGAVDTGFDVAINALPRALEVADGRLYLGGDFNSVNDEPRAKVAAVSTSDGALVDDFAPSFDRGVRALEAADGRLYVGGGFTQVDGEKSRKFTALDRATGARETEFVPEEMGLVYDINVSGGRVYAAIGGRGGKVAAYDTAGGTDWVRMTDGDVTAVTVRGDKIVGGGHFDQLCEGEDLGENGECLDGVYADRGKLFSVDSNNKAGEWNPDANSVTGAHALAHGGGMVAAGGAFTTFGDGEFKRRGFALFAY